MQIKLGASAWDAAAFVRNKFEDLLGWDITDAAIMSYIQPANERFSRSVPLDGLVGNPALQTSPLVTVANQQRYLLTAGSGFVSTPIFIKSVHYSASGQGLTAQNELAAFQMLAFGPNVVYPPTVDSPSTRLLRDSVFDELSRWNRGFYDFVIDVAAGTPALDLYPIPASNGDPVIVRYQGAHTVTPSGADFLVPTIPATRTVDWAKLLLLELYDQEGDRLVRQKSVKAGLIARQQDARVAEMRISRIREEVNGSLGMYVGAGMVSN